MMHTLDISQSIETKFSNFNLFLSIPGMPLRPNFSIPGMILGHNRKNEARPLSKTEQKETQEHEKDTKGE